jgi:hypothetical protein
VYVFLAVIVNVHNMQLEFSFVKDLNPICPRCKNEIDPETCWCGDWIKDHGTFCGHSPVPMGCHCFFAK